MAYRVNLILSLLANEQKWHVKILIYNNSNNASSKKIQYAAL